MSFGDDLRKVWLNIGEVALPIAALRDEYVRFPGVHRRFSQLNNVYQNLLKVEAALFEFCEAKKPVFGSKPEREVLMIAEATLENARILLEIARAELALLGD